MPRDLREDAVPVEGQVYGDAGERRTLIQIPAFGSQRFTYAMTLTAAERPVNATPIRSHSRFRRVYGRH